ncbi:hypothetical protein C5E07_18810 [Pseudoclavibacter sp. RFBJ3]|nr:hypothetical protein C5C12_18885 [Pseudoclavibacter sp. RFBJ5]PPF88701.1 hypothetical protein C5E07_18810 [Pseudoclavibacter sp. RFBJ3]PPF94255.1 hypothetical protein C5C19_18710 [Pseudoclavibacter sp. RFBH5]PPG18246.1 hypothetical protein C5E13_18515 [Pseudoclavibacter sp. RFBI4]
MAAASNLPCTATATATAVTVAGDPSEWVATVPGSAITYTVRAVSTLGPGTITTQNDISHNLTDDSSGWNGGGADDGSEDYQFDDFGAAGSLVLNQRAEGTTAPASTFVPTQTLTFEFVDSTGAAFTPTNFELTVFDISSVANSGWRATYWDAVGFSVAPQSITPTELAAGVGAGTLADPFHREGDDEATPEGSDFFDVFRFATFPTGSTMLYTQNGENQGWQFISIAGLKFDVEVPCAPQN